MIAGRRVMKFEEQFPEAIDLLARALRAGHAFTSGLSMVAEELPAPVGTEFRLAYDRQNFGMPLPAALKELGERVPLLDAKFFVTAVLTQRDAGGNLSEVLDNLASVIRERFKVKRQVRVVTAHARMTGWVLAMLPPGLGVALTFLSPENMSVLWTDPLGIKFLVGALILQVIGTLIIRKLVDIEYRDGRPADSRRRDRVHRRRRADGHGGLGRPGAPVARAAPPARDDGGRRRQRAPPAR